MTNKFYSQMNRIVLNEKDRIKKAKMIFAVLQDFYENLNELNCLDIGCSGGIITNYLASYFKDIIGVDVDENAIRFATERYKKNNLRFYLRDTTKLNFPENYFAVVICNHIYQYVEDKGLLLREIYRVLKPHGICYFSAITLLSTKENAFFAIVPLLNKLKCPASGYSYKDSFFTYPRLKKLATDSNFEIIDYTSKVLINNKFRRDEEKAIRKIMRIIPSKLLEKFIFLSPTHIWILKVKNAEYK